MSPWKCECNRNRVHEQCGAAILTALLLMALVATLSAAALRQQLLAYDLEKAEKTRLQVNWILLGVTDWARIILREDGRSNEVDHLSEPWAKPPTKASLLTFLSEDANVGDGLAPFALQNAFFSVEISDLQSRLNVTGLVVDQKVNAPLLRAFSRLFEELKLPQAELKLLVSNLRSENVQAAGGAGNPLMPRSLSQLQWLGLSARSVTLLKPYTVVLPVPTTVNINTASVLVLRAIVDGSDSDHAQRLIDYRGKIFFGTVAEAATAIGLAETAFGDELLGVNSQYFEIRNRLGLGTMVIQEYAVVQREGVMVKSLWNERELARDDFSVR